MSGVWGDAWGSDPLPNPCPSGICGTGGWSGPEPGDPNNNSVLSAVPAYGGIDLSWTYPTTNPFAVSYVNVFRGTTADVNLAVRRVTISGDYLYDRIPANEIREYFYWIQLVSINGTHGTMIGPVSATPMPKIGEMIELLTGQIDAGVLAESLRGELANIPLLQTALGDEAAERLANNVAMGEALAAVQSETGQALAYISDEITQRTNADEVLLDSVNTLSVGMNGFYAGAVNEILTRVDPNSAVAMEMTTLQASGGSDSAAVQVAMGAVVNAAHEVGALYTAKVNANGLVGGFGIYNDGTEVEAGFDVDKFWIGRTTDKIKPFIIEDGNVYINKAVIQQLTAEQIDATGLDVVNGSFSGSLNVTSSLTGGRMEIKNNVIKVFDNAGILRVKIGDLSA